MRGAGGGTDCESAIYAECQLQSSSDETGSTVGRGAGGFQLQRMAPNGAISNSATPKKSTASYILLRQGTDSATAVVASLSDTRLPNQGQGHVQYQSRGHAVSVAGSGRDRRMSGPDMTVADERRATATSNCGSLRRLMTLSGCHGGDGFGASVESDAMAWASVSHVGTFITLPRSGESVAISHHCDFRVT